MAKNKQPWLHQNLKLSQRRHTGKILPHRHTSHGALLALLLVTGFMLVFATKAIISTVDALTLTESGSVTLGGQVNGPPPRQPAVITSPKNGDSFTRSPINVSGSCPTATFVEVYKNGILGGATDCINGQFGLKIDLIVGQNKLVARVKDNLGQYGPDSLPVIVSYHPAVSGSGTIQLLVSADAQYFGVSAGEPFKLAIALSGGVAPYAVSVDWGDKHQDLVSRPDAGRFEVSHVYKSGDVFYIKINAKDQAGNSAYAETGALIAGAHPQSPSQLAKSFPLLAFIWPLYVSSVAVIAAFWLGEKFALINLIKR